MADGRNIHSGQDSLNPDLNIDSGGDSGRTLIPDLNIPYSETENGSQETRLHNITGMRSYRAAIKLRDNPNRKTESTSNDQTKPVSEDLKRSDPPLDVLPIKKRSRPNEGRMSVENDRHLISATPDNACRRLPIWELCFYKNLSLLEVSRHDGRLYLTVEEASTLPCCPQMTGVTRGSFRKSTLTVFDEQNRQWSMVLTGYNNENQILYTITGDWMRFVRTHGLRHADSVCFYKNQDPRVTAYLVLLRYYKV